MATSPVTAVDAERLSRCSRRWGEPVRLQMASMIAAKPELCVCEITPAFDLSSRTISHHLKTLREAGLVDCEAARHVRLLLDSPRGSRSSVGTAING